jgi:hypothetical protein
MREFFRGWKRKIGCVIRLAALQQTAAAQGSIPTDCHRQRPARAISWGRFVGRGRSMQEFFNFVKRFFISLNFERYAGVIFLASICALCWIVPFQQAWPLVIGLGLVSAYCLIARQPRDSTKPSEHEETCHQPDAKNG